MFKGVVCTVKKTVVFLGMVLLSVSGLTGCNHDSSSTLYLYGAQHYSANGTGTSYLYNINLQDGSGTLIGDTGYALSGMVYDKRTRKLYGTTSISDVNFPNGFVEINIDSGEGTPIGSGAGQNVNCPAVDSLGNMYAWTEDSDDLVTVDLSTGEITVLSDSGVDTAQEGMAFDRNDVLYLVNGRSGCTLYTIDTETGVGTEEGSFGLSGNIAHHGTIHPETGEYWGLDATATAAPTRNILILDLDALTLSTNTTPNTIPTVDSLHMITFFYR